MRARIAVALACLVLVAPACGGGKGDGGAGESAGATTTTSVVDLRGKAEGGSYPEVAQDVRDNVFDPSAIRIDPGVTVSWKNSGRNAHTITPSVATQDFGGVFGVTADSFGPGQSYEFRFDAPGVYPFYCTLHGTATKGMIGLVIVGAGDANGGGDGTAAGADAGTIHVPKDQPTIQAAVDAAAPGALVLVAPGVYHEAVTVTSPGIVVRGESRSGTVLDGQFDETEGHENGFKVLADGVAIENITAQNFKSNGFYWTGVTGFRGSYLTALRNGDYGIYAFDSTNGDFDHDYAAGSPDAGFYVGQCFPCHVLITDVESEWNGLGYSGTNAGGDLVIANSSWHDNRAGIVPNSGSGEANPPQHDATIVGNVVYSNNNGATAAIEVAQTATGNGILLAGANDNIVERNRVFDHDISGIGVVPLPEKILNPSNANAINFDVGGNQIQGNVVSDSRQAADIVIVATLDPPTNAMGNCVSGNTFSTTLPDGVEQLLPCGQPASASYSTDVGRFLGLVGAAHPVGADYRTVVLPAPPTLSDMPDALTAPAAPATGAPPTVDVDAIEVPAMPTG